MAERRGNRQTVRLPPLRAVSGSTITRREYDDLARRIAVGEASHVTMTADIVRVDKELLVVTHSIEGDGVAGLADDMRDLKIWRASPGMAAMIENVRVLMLEREGRTLTGKEQIANRYRAILLAISIIVGIGGLAAIVRWLGRLGGAVG